MPLIHFTLGELATGIIDPVSNQVVHSLIDKLGLTGQFRNSIFTFNDRTAASQTEDGDGNINLSRNRLDIQVETIYDPSALSWQTAADFNQPAYGVSPRREFKNQLQTMIYDHQSGMSVEEITTPFGLSFDISMAFQTYDSAQLALMKMRNYASGTAILDSHDIVYTYPTPLTFMGMLYQVYIRKAKLDKTKVNFYQWVNALSRVQLDWLVRKYDFGKSKINRQLVFKKQQKNCQAVMEVQSTKPEPEMYEQLATSFKLHLTYRIQFGMPTLLQLNLPIVVDNNPMPNVLFTVQETSSTTLVEAAMQTESFTKFLKRINRSDAPYTNTMVPYLRLPYYDKFILPESSLIYRFKYNMIFSGVALTPADGTPISISLNSLDGIQIHPIVKQLLTQHTAEDVFGTSGLFNISVFSNDLPLSADCLTFNPDTLGVTFVGTNIHHIYRIVLSEATQIAHLDSKWYDTLMAYRWYFPMTIERNLKHLVDMGVLRIDYDNGYYGIVAHAMVVGQFDSIINAMIAQGYCTREAFQYTGTTSQFCIYSSHKRPLRVPPQAASNVEYGYTLADIFCDMCIANGLITEEDRPSRSIIKTDGYPYGKEYGDDFQGFNVPLRVLSAELRTQNGNPR